MSFGELFDRVAGDAGAVEGIETARDHAERIEEGWAERAIGFVQGYVMQHQGKQFIAPEVRKWAEARGLSAPASPYAWGNVFRLSSRRKIIRSAGYSRYGDSTMHTQSVQVWIGI